jgi:hypothetical protein
LIGGNLIARLQSVPVPNDTSASELPTPEPSTTSTSAKKKKKKKKKKTKVIDVASLTTSEATNGVADHDDEEPMSPATDGGKQGEDLPPTPMSASGVLPLMEGSTASTEERSGAAATEESKSEAEPKVEEKELSATEPAAEEAAPENEEVEEEQDTETHTKEEVKPGEPTSELKEDDKAEISNEHVTAEPSVAAIAEPRTGSEATEKPAQPTDAEPSITLTDETNNPDHNAAEHSPTADAPIVEIAAIVEEPTPEEKLKVVEPVETPSLAEQEATVKEDQAAEPATESAPLQTTEAGLGPEAVTETAAVEKAGETIAGEKEEGSKTESAETKTPAPGIGDHEKPVEAEAEAVPVTEEAEESKEEPRATEDALEHPGEEKSADTSDISVAAPKTTEDAKAGETPTTETAPEALTEEKTAEHIEAEKAEESGKPAEQLHTDVPVEATRETPAEESKEPKIAETTEPAQEEKAEFAVEETNKKANPEPSEQPSEATPVPEQVVAGIPEEAPAEGTRAVDVPEAAEVEAKAAEAETIPELVVQEIYPAAESQLETEVEIVPAPEPEPVQEVGPVQETAPPDETTRSQDGTENAPAVTVEVPEIEEADATEAEAGITPEPVAQEEIDPAAEAQLKSEVATEPAPVEAQKVAEPAESEEHAKGEDEVVEVSHEDAPPAETEAEKPSEEQTVPAVEEAVSQEAVVEEKEHGTFEPEVGDKPAEASYAEVANELVPEEFKVDPLPASEITENPIDLVPGEPVPKDNVTAESLNDNVKLNKEAYEGTEPNVPIQFSEERKGAETPVPEVDNTTAEVADVAEKLDEPTAPEESEEIAPEAAVPAEDLSKDVSVAPLPASENAENSIQLQPGEPVPVVVEAASVEDHVRLDKEAYEGTHPIVPLKLAEEERKSDTPIQEVADTAAEVADVAEKLDGPTDSGEAEEKVSVTPLPASENAENPIHLQPGEPIPDAIKAASVEDHVRLDKEAYEGTNPIVPLKLAEEERKSDTPIQEVADTAAEVADVAEKLDGPTDSGEAEEKVSVTPLPASENAENPIHLQPGEPIPDAIKAASVEDHVRLDKEAYEGTHPIVPLKLAEEERKSDTPIQEVADTAAEVADVAEKLDGPAAPEKAEEAALEAAVPVEDLSKEVSIAPLPASENAENPIQLQPGESIPEAIKAASVEDHVRLDKEAYEGTRPLIPVKLAEEERKSNTPIQEVADTAAEVADVAEKLDEGVASEKAEEKAVVPEDLSKEVSVAPLPASESAENPIHLQPGEAVPEDIKTASVEDHVRLDKAAYEGTHPIVPLKLTEERKSDTPIQEVTDTADTAAEVADVATHLDGQDESKDLGGSYPCFLLFWFETDI